MSSRSQLHQVGWRDRYWFLCLFPVTAHLFHLPGRPACSQVTPEVSDPEPFTGTVWGALVAFAGVLSSFASLFFYRTLAPLSTSIWFRGSKVSVFSSYSFFLFQWVSYQYLHRETSSSGRVSVSGPVLKVMRAFFLPLHYLIHILIKWKAGLLLFYLVFVRSTSVSQFRMFWRLCVEIWHPSLLGSGILAD